MFTVFEAYSGIPVYFAYTKEQAENWILDQIEAIDGRKIYRTWSEDGYDWYDVGKVYKVKYED